MPRTIDFTVTPEYDGRKTVHFLRGGCGFSARVMKRVKYSLVCNGKPLRTIDIVKAGDVISVTIPDDDALPEALCAEINVVYEDDDILVVNKSPFMAMHPTHNHQGDTLANAVTAYLAQKGKNAAFRAVGRLDKGTSGLVVCALNKLSASKLAGGVQKEYYALVKGKLEGEGRMDVPIYRPDPMKTLRACSYELGVEPAVTNWKAEKNFEGATLLSLRLETGRTHQIRVHMAFSGHPLAGDDMYGDFMTEIGHQLLHCRRCFLVHPVTGEKMEFEADFYDDFINALDSLGNIE
ncbi:MAG: RluA family pseudouridine synthase [Clostridia bacterium]|nr:RluA family pseudouridine synthase [Clostridia bacterium]